jgi:hypothetical protein
LTAFILCAHTCEATELNPWTVNTRNISYFLLFNYVHHTICAPHYVPMRFWNSTWGKQQTRWNFQLNAPLLLPFHLTLFFFFFNSTLPFDNSVILFERDKQLQCALRGTVEVDFVLVVGLGAVAPVHEVDLQYVSFSIFEIFIYYDIWLASCKPLSFCLTSTELLTVFTMSPEKL